MKDSYHKNPKDKDEECLTERERTIGHKLQAAIHDRARWRSEWTSNEASIYDTGYEGAVLRDSTNSASISDSDNSDAGTEGSGADNFMGLNPSARNLQVLHSQLCSNPPVVMAVPVSDEESDKDSAEAAELVCQHIRQQKHVDSWFANFTLNTHLYGTGFIKLVYRKDLGLYIYNDRNCKNEQLGDFSVGAPRPWDMYIDPNATHWDEVTWISERIFVDIDDATAYFGEEHRDQIEASSMQLSEIVTAGVEGHSLLYTIKNDVVEIFERWEPGLPSNNFLGRLEYHLRGGKILKTCEEVPSAFKLKEGGSAVVARLPYQSLTYIDVPNSVWGRSPAALCARAQNVLNAITAVELDTAHNMGIPRMIATKGAIGPDTERAATNSSVDIISLESDEGSVFPTIMQAANTSQDLKILFDKLSTYINDAWGVNDALLGKQERETQGVTMQISIQQGNMIRENFFNKYVRSINWFYEMGLAYYVKFKTLSQMIHVVGPDNKIQARKLKGADIVSGYVLVVERGTSFALDPITRQEQITNLMKVFQDGGLDTRFLIRQLKLADLRGIYAEFDLADNRAKMIIEKLKNKDEVKIRTPEDHIGIGLYLSKYVMSSEYDELDDDVKDLIDKHIDARESAAANRAAPQGQPSGQPQQQLPQAPMGVPEAAPVVGPR
jgi:hypothetical protein